MRQVRTRRVEREDSEIDRMGGEGRRGGGAILEGTAEGGRGGSGGDEGGDRR